MSKKLNIHRFQKYWEKQGRRDLFTWVHRYLRLHSELLADSIYQNIYDYHRNTLITYLKNDTKNEEFNTAQLGEILDSFADIFNKYSAERVEKYKWLVEELYTIWGKNHSD